MDGRRQSRLLPAFLLVLLVAAALFFSRLRAPLLEPQEARYAEIPRQMLAEGEWLVPRLHGQAYLDKPPLLYWSVMASYRIFGIRDWAARIVAGLAGVLTALFVYIWGRRVLGDRAGLCAALVLCLMPEFVYRGRMLTFDTLLMLWVTAGLALAHLALASGRWWPWLLSAFACGLGLLTKGPVALVLIAVPVFAAGWLDARLRRPSPRAWAAYLGVAVAVSAPWFVAVSLRERDFAEAFFWTHHVVRFVAPFDHAKPAWFYLPGLLAGLVPWCLLLPGLGRLLLARAAPAGGRPPSAVGFALLAFAWGLLFFSASGCKRPTYLLPTLPPLALAIGWYLARGRAADLWRRASLPAGAAAGVVLVALAGVSALALWLGHIPAGTSFALAGAAASGLALLTLWLRHIAWRHTVAVSFAALWLGVLCLLPAYNDLFSLRKQLLRSAAAPESGARPVVCYPQRYDSASFYLPESDVRAFSTEQRPELLAHLERHPGTLLVVKSGPALERLLAELPAGVEFLTQERRAAIVVGRVVRRTDGADRLLAQEEE
jgi:4-amino-4-deoxy-L-arabinose transferase-like glycosyltransferase